MCGFSTCNLSYGELSCSLLFGSNRLMPRARLNKSFMRSSGQKKKQPLLCSSLFLKVPFCEGSSCLLNFSQLVRCVSSNLEICANGNSRKENLMETHHLLKTCMYSKTVFTLQQGQDWNGGITWATGLFDDAVMRISCIEQKTS